MSVITQEKPAALTISEVTHSEGLADLETEWRRLTERCSSATVFQTYDWIAAWWRCLGCGFGRSLRIVTFRDSDHDLVGLAPLMISPWYGTPIKRLTFLGMGVSDYLDLLAVPGLESDICRHFYRYLAESLEWQVADLQQLREGGLLRDHAPDNIELSPVEQLQEPCPYLPLPRTGNDLNASFGKKTRANIGYYERSMRKLYDVHLDYLTDPAGLDNEIDRLFDLHKRRWNRRMLPGVFGAERVRRFHKEVSKALLARNFLRLFRLRLDGSTQACLYCFSHGGRLCYYQAGFDPAYSKLSPGTVLTAYAMRTAIDEGCDTFDLLRGDEPYKAKWTQLATVNMRRTITRRSQPYLGKIARFAIKSEDSVERRVKAWARSRK